MEGRCGIERNRGGVSRGDFVVDSLDVGAGTSVIGERANMTVTDERLNQLANDPMMCNITPEMQECLRELIEMRVSRITQSDWKRLNRVFKTTSDKTIDQDMQIEQQKIVMEDLSMLIRMMVTKHKRGKLDDEYCQKALDYLQRKGLQGSVLRAT